jgi:hypothetical protein
MASQPDDWGRARYRLRDLQGRDRLYAIGLVVLVLVPFAVALTRAFHDGWVPSGDEANIATRALDVFSRHPPLTGLPSTSALYGDRIPTNHPGPIEFYLIAVPLRVLGMSAGPLLTAATINAACALIVLWVFLRRLGLTAMLWAGVMLLAVIWSAGTAVLTDTLSSNMPLYSLLCTSVLVWALADGDLPLLPLAALTASYAAQQHLAAGLVVLALVLVAVGALVVQIVTRIRRGDQAIKKLALRWSTAAFVVAGACWAPVVYDEVSKPNGNLTEIVRFARDNSRPTLGPGKGIDQALRAVTPPTILGRTDTSGLYFLNGLGAFHYVLGALVVGALGVLGVFAWRTRGRWRALAPLALVGLVLLFAGFVNGTNVPHSLEAWRINLYRWTWAAAFVTWTALGIGAALLVRRLVARSTVAERAQRLGRLAPVALLVVGALITTAIVFVSGGDDHNRERSSFAVEKRVAAVVLDRVDRDHPIVIVSQGFAANLSISPYLIFRLVEAGVTVEVPKDLTPPYGRYRQYDPRSGASALVVVSGERTLPSLTNRGEVITKQSFSPERAALLTALTAKARATKIELAPDADELVDREYPGLVGLYVKASLARLPTDPRAALAQPVFLKLVLKGILRSPVLDEAKVRRLIELSPDLTTIGGDEQVEVRLLDPDEVRKARLPGL